MSDVWAQLGDTPSPDRSNRAKTHCNAGHPLSGENLFVERNGGRRCRECARAGKRRRYAEKRRLELARRQR